MRELNEPEIARINTLPINLHHKDAVLDRIGYVANIAQFISFGPDGSQRFARVHGYAPNYQFESMSVAAEVLLNVAPDNSVNVRSFTPENPKSREFVYGLRKVDDVVSTVRRLTESGLFTIANETIDINDGGVSGVCFGNVLEFAPGDTPRCVEKPGVASFPLRIGLELLEKVYRFRPNLYFEQSQRVEFSIHPLRRGYRHEHTIIWELEEVGGINISTEIRWPNRFSRFIGDKAFGLLVADLLHLPVPATTVVARQIAPFFFGQSTGSGEIWIRTCPVEPVPGYFTTQRGWRDPFTLLATEDPAGKLLASALSQEGIDAVYSGALVADAKGRLTIEGVRGFGDEFMLGRANKEELPSEVEAAVRELYQKAYDNLGPVRMEWVFDGNIAWVVQLHHGATSTSGDIIFPGETHYYHRYSVEDGIDKLRELIATVSETHEGIILVGNIGVTSHLGDLLRKAKIPSKIEHHPI